VFAALVGVSSLEASSGRMVQAATPITKFSVRRLSSRT
jgi:hypothetical protein